MLSTRNFASYALAGFAALSLSLIGCSSTKAQRVKPAPTAVAMPAAPAQDAKPVPPPEPAPAASPGLAPVAPTPFANGAPPTQAPPVDATPVAPATPPLTGGPPAKTGTAAAPAPRALDKLFPQPPALDRDVNFWIRIYTEVGTNAGFVHDQYNLGVVYETLQFGPDSTARQREQMVGAARARIVAALRRIASGNGALSSEDQHIRDMWGDAGTPARLLSATEDVRFQLGQADRFREGLLRSGSWQPHIVETLANLGLPVELAVLPHVESSFNAAAYSKAGAAGLWQFMRSTGRRYMRIDSAVDDRMDPFRSTEAAAQLLSFNYRLLGTWPLALTAYNHGAEGMRRAKEAVGTDDILRIVRNYHSPTFGFASRNYYVSFLAALTVDRNPEKYFGPIKREPEARFQDVRLPGFVSVSALTHALHISADELRRLNPAVLPACWEGRRRIPEGYVLRLPLNGPGWTSQMLAARLSPADLQARQTVPERRKVSKGESLASIAADYGMKPAELARLNGFSPRTRLRPGRYVRVPEATPIRVAARVDHSADQASGNATTADTVAASAAPSQAADTTASVAAPITRMTPEPAAAPDVSSAPAPVETSSAPAVLAANDTAAAAAAPAPTATTDAAATPPAATPAAAAPDVEPETNKGGVSAQVAQQESEQDARAVAQDRPLAASQPVSAVQAEALTPGLGPTAMVAADNADATDYSVAADDTVIVAPTETLGALSGWLNVSPARLRALNHLKPRSAVQIGRKLKLDFAHTSHAEFESQRHAYHRQLQAAYFASHRISGTKVHVARSGDTLWNLARRFGELPPWLLQQYNPDVGFGSLKAGTQIVVPRVEDLGSAGSDG